MPVRVPLATASTPSGVVISKLKVALSLGWSLAGNQVLAPSGSEAAKLPSSGVPIHPTSPKGPSRGSGVPSKSTVTATGSSAGSGSAGASTRSSPARRGSTFSPSLEAAVTVRASRSKRSSSSCSVVRRRMVATASKLTRSSATSRARS